MILKLYSKKINLTRLTTSKFFARHKNFQNFVIAEYLHRNINKFQLETSMFQTLNYDQQFFVVNFVIALNWHHVFVEKSHEMKNFFVVVLKEHFIVDVIENMNFQNDFFIAIKMTKRRNDNNCFFQKLKNFITNVYSLKKKHFLWLIYLCI